jgi:hypothetical protein
VSNDPDEPNGPGGRNYSNIGGANTSVNIQGLSQATSQINAFNAALAQMQTTLTKLAGAAPGLSSTISSAVGKFGGGSGGGPGGGGPSSGGFISSAFDMGSSMFGKVQEKGWMRDFLMFPTRFMRSAISDNRQLALLASAGLGQQAFGAGVGTQGMMGALAGQFGNVLGGSPADLVNLMNAAGSYGAGIDWRNLTPGSNRAGGGPRAGGFFQSVQQAQMMSPGTDVGTLAGAIGGYAGNVGAQQQSAFLTGGAFSMIGAGNRQKSISEWATGILKWLQNIRGGSQRGKPFTYPELLSQNFPGSNIDAWLTANGVTPDMKGFFWSYAMAQAGRSQSDIDALFTTNSVVNENVAYTRLKASAAETRTGFRLAGTMSGAYANKEQANQFFAELSGHLLQQVLPSAMGTGALSFMQFLPDTIEEIIMQLAERTGLGTLGAGVAGWGGSGVLQNLLGAGDVGDVGDYGSLGGTSTAGLHPDTRKRVDAMMNANPRLRVTSGFRDLGTQQRLRRQGVGRVSGRPSAHTRGMAADLGPASEYGWISRNARRFGLKSGRSQGEPWHVGMAGDVGDPLSDALAKYQSGLGLQDIQSAGIAETLTSLLGGLFGGITGTGSQDAQIKGIGQGSAFLMKMLMGAFGGQANMDRIGYTNVYDKLVSAANAQTGLPTGMSSASSGWLSNIFGTMTGMVQGAIQGGAIGGGFTGPVAPGAVTGGPGGVTIDAFFRSVLAGMGAPVTQNNLLKLAAVAKQEGNGSNFNPFNSMGGDFPNKANKAGVENYPDWNTGVNFTIRLLSQGNTSAMRSNLMSDAGYNEWLGATSAFYHTWGGGSLNISQGGAEGMLTKNVHGAGDVDYYASGAIAPLAAPRVAPMIFQNHFQIDGGGNGAGIDVRRTATLLADQLETEMNRRMARRN